MRRLHHPAELSARGTLIRWSAQALAPGRGGAAWALGDAVAVLAPALNRHDRLVLDGSPGDVRALLDEHYAPGLSPLVTSELAAGLGVPVRAAFGWMERADPGDLPERAPECAWLPESDWPEVTALLAAASPHSYVWPGEPGPTRWAGIRIGGVLAAVAADAWSTEGVGFVGGVATHPDFRRRGLSSVLCAFVTAELLERHGECALMVDRNNPTAIGVYARLGYAYRELSVLDLAAVRAGGPEAGGTAGKSAA
ncbi:MULTISPECIES: GNAT family N-acetyltransferase [Actinosynnema]|uniref:GNAT family N-acetyltransferase n=1 Tax=Actinosynnema TaxID=40566 RepID=UPI0020A4CEA1|nr:GNAT family N-acetyltransferase [Actinosynnema pretiosum]MCP2095893.1 FR47-like protein [Actinosynnema pretiosum]